MTTMFPSTEASDMGTLEIRLPERVGARELQAFLALMNETYLATERLALATQSAPGSLSSEEIASLPRSASLQIEYLEIGTPNKITLAGSVKGLTAIVTLLTGIIGVPIAGAIAYKTFAEGQKTFAETLKIIEETEVIKSQRLETEKLHKQGRVPENMVLLQGETVHMLAFELRRAAPLLLLQELHVERRT